MPAPTQRRNIAAPAGARPARPAVLPVAVKPGAGRFFHGRQPLPESLVSVAWPVRRRRFSGRISDSR